jgi:DnaJ-class molecular chaperone
MKIIDDVTVYRKCSTCDGQGKMVGFGFMQTKCKECDGKGRFEIKPEVKPEFVAPKVEPKVVEEIKEEVKKEEPVHVHLPEQEVRRHRRILSE